MCSRRSHRCESFSHSRTRASGLRRSFARTHASGAKPPTLPLSKARRELAELLEHARTIEADGDTTRAMEGAYLTKARKVGTRDQAVLLPLHTGRHAGGLRLLQQTVEQ